MMERINFVSSFFRSMKNLSKEVKQKEEKISSETSRGFEEAPCTSYDKKMKQVLQRDPNNWTIPFPFENKEKMKKYGGHLDHNILSEYLVEYRSQPIAFKETISFP